VRIRKLCKLCAVLARAIGPGLAARAIRANCANYSTCRRAGSWADPGGMADEISKNKGAAGDESRKGNESLSAFHALSGRFAPAVSFPKSKGRHFQK
jgi:hypothetical protein